jgi:hypothetical protein
MVILKQFNEYESFSAKRTILRLFQAFFFLIVHVERLFFRRNKFSGYV